jgi:hypothetical protein
MYKYVYIILDLLYLQWLILQVFIVHLHIIHVCRWVDK